MPIEVIRELSVTGSNPLKVWGVLPVLITVGASRAGPIFLAASSPLTGKV